MMTCAIVLSDYSESIRFTGVNSNVGQFSGPVKR